MSDTQTPLVVQCRVCWQFYGVERGTRATSGSWQRCPFCGTWVYVP